MTTRQEIIALTESLLTSVEKNEDLIDAAERQNNAAGVTCAKALREGAALEDALRSIISDSTMAFALAKTDHDPRVSLSLALTEWRLQEEHRDLWWSAASYPVFVGLFVLITGVTAQWWQHSLAEEWLLLVVPALGLIGVTALSMIGQETYLPESWRWRMAADQASRWRRAAALAGRNIPEAQLQRTFGNQQELSSMMLLLARPDGAQVAESLAEYADDQARKRLRRCGNAAIWGLYLISAAVILASIAGSIQAGSQVTPTGLKSNSIPSIFQDDAPGLPRR